MQNNIQFLLANNESLQHYLSQVKATEPLTLAEEQALGRRIMAGDRKALHLLVEANLRFVLKCINDMNIYVDVPVEELIAAGNEGLTIAAKRYDPSYPNKFCSYAVHHIQKAINDAVKTWICAVAMPDLQQELYRCMSLENTFDEEDEDKGLLNLISTIPAASMPAEIAWQTKEAKEHLHAMLSQRLYPGEVKLLMGFAQMTYDGYNMAEIAKEFGLPTRKMKAIISALQKKVRFHKLLDAFREAA